MFDSSLPLVVDRRDHIYAIDSFIWCWSIKLVQPRHFLLEGLYQARKVSSRVFVYAFPLRFPHETMFDSSLPLVVDRRDHIYAIGVCLCIVMSKTYCVVSLESIFEDCLV
jgi:hypothetical protein